jgi:hypothetical protein
MPSAFTVANSPITSSGDIAVTGAGLASQYVRGDGTLANFPTSTGGGASVSYYLNGSVSQGTLGGVAYKEMNSVPIIGTGTDFTINADGYIAQFITDVGDPNKLLIPAGNWNFETYFSASSGGGSPRFYIELYKYNGATFTLIASNSATPENITGGTAIDLYFTAIAVPTTTLLATDRLAVRFYVIHSGRTITMHTEDSHLSQIITTFSTGLTDLNGLTSQTQYFAVGTTGTDFNISSVTDTHTFNLPTASATNRGALSSADWSTFNTAYTDRLKWDGGATGLVAATGRTSLELGTFAVANYPTWSSGTPFVKMTAAGTFSLDTNTYLTSVGTGVANELTYWSGVNTLGSLATATYPSLTELSYVKGVTSAIQTQIDTKQNKLKSFNRQTSSYTLVLSDADKLVEMNVATANNLTIPLNSTVTYAVGTQIDIVQYGAGQTSIVATVGVTIRSTNSWLKINARYGAVTLTKVGTDEWYLWGNLNA